MQINGTDYGSNWIWPDEFDWSPVIQGTEHTVTGALVVEEAIRQAGRPITLEGEWLTRAQVEALQALRDLGGSLTLNWRGTNHTVYWRQGDKPLEVRQVFDTNAPDAGDYYETTLRFFEG